jgi:hypothetical protein
MTIKHLFPATKPTLDLNFAAERLLDPRITYTRASTGTYVDARGIVRTAANDEPRFDHDPATGESLGLLIEESRVNYVENSIDFNAGDWNFVDNGTAPAGPTCTPNAGTAPDGTNTATRMECALGGGTTNLDECYLTSNRDGSAKRVVSLWMKSNTGADQTVFAAGFGNPVVTSTWQRFTGTTNDWSVGARGDVSDQNIDILIWGAQVEDGDEAKGFPTSYIATAGATATRAADRCSITGDNFSSWFNQSAGTFIGTVSSRGRLLLSSVSTGPNVYQDTTYGFSSNGETGGASFNLRYEDRSQILLMYYTAGWTSTVPMQNYAGAYSAEGVSAAWQGKLGTPPAPLSKPLQDDLSHMWIGRTHPADSGVQRISRIAYYPRRLSDEQLQALTS